MLGIFRLTGISNFKKHKDFFNCSKLKRGPQMKLKMKLISLACMSLVSGVAAAQQVTIMSEVTPAKAAVEVYGVIDLGILSESNLSNPALGYLPSSTNKGSVLEMKDGGLGESYWGIKGSEDLGGGLRANFNLQGNFLGTTGVSGGPNSSGTTSLFNQQANVGLSGNFGEVEFGRVVSPIYWAFSSTDVRKGAYFGSSLIGLVGLNSATGAFAGNNSNAVAGAIFNDNAVLYNSPKMGGLNGSLEYTLGGVSGDNSALRQEAATLMYSTSNWKFDALIYNGNDDGVRASANPNGTNTNRLVQLGALYTFNALSASAGYWKATDPAHTGAGTNPASLGGAVTSGDLNMYNLGLGYQASVQLNLTSGLYHIQDEDTTANHATMYVLGLDYALSKTTRLYLEGANVHNQGSNMNLAAVYGVPVTAGANTTAYMAGIRHVF
jgi:predicted porin